MRCNHPTRQGPYFFKTKTLIEKSESKKPWGIVVYVQISALAFAIFIFTALIKPWLIKIPFLHHWTQQNETYAEITLP